MVRAIVTDIEGTTSSISFVHEILFPYSRRELPSFIRSHQHDQIVAKCLDDVRREVGKPLSVDQVIAQLETWIEQDKKITPLKALQGMVWENGYRKGDFKGHIYPDAFTHLKRWHDKGLKLYVYSSGSVHAQKLLFEHTEYGDLTGLFSGYFDTSIGHKREPSAYQAILRALELPGEQVLFLSDIKQELDAARAAGMKTAWLIRKQAQSDNFPPHPQATTFDEVRL